MTPLQELLKLALSLGISVVGPESPEALCPPGFNSSYHFELNRVSLCHKYLHQQYIIHEFIHVAQRCKAKKEGNPDEVTLAVLWPRTNPYTNSRLPHGTLSRFLESVPYYSIHRQHLPWEYEAWSHQSMEANQAIEMLKTYCL